MKINMLGQAQDENGNRLTVIEEGIYLPIDKYVDAHGNTIAMCDCHGNWTDGKGRLMEVKRIKDGENEYLDISVIKFL